MNIRPHMQLFLICFLSVFLSISANAQQFSGNVSFTDGTACSNAEVRIFNNISPDKEAQTLSKEDGTYALDLNASVFDRDIVYAFATMDWLSKMMNFKVSLNSNSKLRVSLYDISGRELAVIINRDFEAGIHQFSWNCAGITNLLERSIYFINFRSSNSNTSLKFIQDATQRLDFYTEYSENESLENTTLSEATYTAVIKGDNFETHTVYNLKDTDLQQDFIINKDALVKFKCGTKYIEQYKGDKYVPFYIKGINLGAAIPGTSPAQMAPTEAQYSRWFSMMANAGYNLIRIYTLHYPRFYDALKKYNEANPATPLYLMHGAWLDEEYVGFEHDPDLYTSMIGFVRDVNESTEIEFAPIMDYFDDRIVEVIDVVHGNAVLPERWGWASGEYTSDVSPWLLGYIMGREIYANEVVGTDESHPDITSYTGTIFNLEDASATEAWATERLDKAMAHEQSQYKQQHPISFSSWPTLDPIDHPTENGPEDMVQVNLNEIDETNSAAGYFASYHVYPYFPDFISCDPDYQEFEDYMGSNSYLGYLTDLKSQYPDRPLIISEFGVSSSWGTSRFSSNNMHHGGLSEEEQGDYTVRMMHNINDANCGGSIQFSWIDEWFKYVWIFGQNTNGESRNRWHNIYSAEENYGMIGFIPEEANFSKFGYSSNAERISQVRISSDIEALYIKVELKEELSKSDTLWLALDTYNSAKGESILPNDKLLYNRSEFCVNVTPDETNLYVTKAYDMFGIGQEGYPVSGQYFRSIGTDGAGWNKVKWRNHRDDDYCAGNTFDAGTLRIRDNSNPLRGDAVILDGNFVTIKLPWAMIYFNDPSQLKVAHITDYSLYGGSNSMQTADSDGIAVTTYLGKSRVTAPRYTWEKWDSYTMPPTKEQAKSSLYIITETLKTLPTYVK